MSQSGLRAWLLASLPYVLFGLALGAIAAPFGRRPSALASHSATVETPRTPPLEVPLARVVSPVPGTARLSSGYGMRAGRRSGRPTFHAGADFAAPIGTPVVAPRAGRVIRVVHDAARTAGFRGYGNAVVLFHPHDGCWTLYAHLAELRAREGQQVVAGAPIGTIGATSNGRFRAMGPHLHFEVRRARGDGGPPFPGPYRVNNVDPERWLASFGIVYPRARRLGAFPR